jgi:hypothetical protein
LIRRWDNSRISEEYRALLNTSAWITCRHPQLKKAIWLVESGGTLKVPLLDYDDWSNWPGASVNDDTTDIDMEGSEPEETDDDSSQNVGGMVANNGHGIEDDDKEDEHVEDFGRDMTDDVHLCCLTVKIVAVDRGGRSSFPDPRAVTN